MKNNFEVKEEVKNLSLTKYLNYLINKFQGDIEFLKKYLLNQKELYNLQGKEDDEERINKLWTLLKERT